MLNTATGGDSRNGRGPSRPARAERRTRYLPVRVVQPTHVDPAEVARRLREIADIGLAAARRTQAVETAEAVSPQVTQGGLETRLGQAGGAHA